MIGVKPVREEPETRISERTVEVTDRMLVLSPIGESGRVVGHDASEGSVSRTTYDPCGWRLAEIASSRTDELRRRELVESLIVAEAEEIALGRRHLTVVHGAPGTMADSAALDAFYDKVFSVSGLAAWSRVRGTEEFVTVTIGGTGMARLLLELLELAHRADPGTWRVLERPFFCAE